MLFHKDIVIPKNLKLPSGTIRLTYSDHAKKAANNDQYGYIPLPAKLDTEKVQVVEVETDNSAKVVKILYRTKMSDSKDICLAVRPNGVVKTVWANMISDSHRTLDRTKYVGGS